MSYRTEDYAKDPDRCTQCHAARAIGKDACHFHRRLADPAELSAMCAREARIAARRLLREHPNASYLPGERAALVRAARGTA